MDPVGETFIRQYVLLVESADRASARRQATNSVLLTISSALVATWGVGTGTDVSHSASRLVITVVGILVAALWWSLLEAHKKLSEAKFAVIVDMETQLPYPALTTEWKSLQESGYREVTTLEGWLPAIFVIVHVLLSVITLV